MGLTSIDCGTGSTFVLSNNNGSSVVIFLDTVNPPARGVVLDDKASVTVPCTGTLYMEDSGAGALGQLLVPIPQFPYESALMGLAGIVCASFIAWAFLRG